MTNPIVLESIVANGGWCELHYPKNKSLAESLYARLVLVMPDFLLLEKFDLASDKLSGHLAVLTNTRQRLKKANFVKQILKIGGKSLPDQRFSVFQNIDSLQNLFKIIQERKEPVLINQFNKSDLATILSSDSQKIICLPFNSNDLATSFEVQLTEISSLEMQTVDLLTKITQIGG